MPIACSQEFFQDLLITLHENTSDLQNKKIFPSPGVSFLLAISYLS